MAKENVTTNEDIVRGTGGSVNLENAMNPHPNHSRYRKTIRWQTGVHSHNTKEAPNNSPGNIFSGPDKGWAIRTGMAIILVDDAGNTLKYTPPHGLTPSNTSKIGNVCDCDKKE